MQDKKDSPTRPSSTSSTNSATRKRTDPFTTDPLGNTASDSSLSTSSGSAAASAGAVMDQAKETISSVASKAGNTVATRLDKQKEKAAQGLGSVAQALRQTGEQLRAQNQEVPVDEYVATAADQIERFSGYVRSKSVREMVGGVEQFARRQPGLFLGGALVLGLLGARFLKSSAHAEGGDGSMPRNRSLIAQDDFSSRSGMGNRSFSGASYSGSGAARSTYGANSSANTYGSERSSSEAYRTEGSFENTYGADGGSSDPFRSPNLTGGSSDQTGTSRGRREG